MKDVTIYTRATCGYCRRAKALLDRKGIAYGEIDIDREPARRAEMIERANGRSTVPQIFIDGTGIGGCDDLHALDAAGKLDILLASA
jgi:glutaredoxin 3